MLFRNQLLLLIGILIPFYAFSQPIRVEIVLQEGDTPPGLSGQPVATLNSPYTNGNGEVGFTGTYGVGTTETFVWFDGAVVWRNPDALPGNNLSGGEHTMGVGDMGEYAYSPSIDGDDGIWTHSGAFIQEGDPAPGFAGGSLITFASRPTVKSDGTIFWVSGIDTTGGTSTRARALYKGTVGGSISAIHKSGDVIGGFPIDDGSSGIMFTYGVSNDGTHVIQEVEFNTGSTGDNNAIIVDSVLVAKEGDVSSDGSNDWDNFDLAEINESGDYFFQGDLTGSSTRDEMIAVNGVIAVRESDTLDGVELTSPANVDAASINDLGQIAHVWSMTGGTEALFIGEVSDLYGTSRKVLMTGDSVDVDGDGNADALMTAFNASNSIGPGLDFAEDGWVYVEVDLEYSGSIHYDAIIGIEVDCATRPRAGSDNAELICDGTPAVDMLTLLLGSPDTGGVWLDSTFGVVSGTFDPASDPAGTYYYVQVDTGCGNDTAVLDLSVDICIGMDQEELRSITVYPNPASDHIIIEGLETGQLELSILDLTGKTIHSNTFENSLDQQQINLSGMAEGIYFMRIKQRTQTWTRKILVQR